MSPEVVKQGRDQPFESVSHLAALEGVVTIVEALAHRARRGREGW